jgi:protein-disulfide isomerase
MELNKPAKSKKQTLREKRLQQQRKHKMRLALTVIGVIVFFVALIAIISFTSSTPIEEDVILITPKAHPMENGPALGDPNAPVKIEVYSDFQCPACQAFAQQIEPQVVDTFVANGTVYYVYRHFPFLDDRAPTKESDQAANASMCAAEQQRFWDYHDILFANWNGENQGAFNDRRLIAFAQALNLNMDDFSQCFKEKRYWNVIQDDLSAGKRANVQGTPSVLVNGKMITPGYVPSFEDIKQAVEAALSSSQK